MQSKTSQNEMICVLTDIDIMSNAPYLDTVCDTVIHLLYDDGYLLDAKFTFYMMILIIVWRLLINMAMWNEHCLKNRLRF